MSIYEALIPQPSEQLLICLNRWAEDLPLYVTVLLSQPAILCLQKEQLGGDAIGVVRGCFITEPTRSHAF